MALKQIRIALQPVATKKLKFICDTRLWSQVTAVNEAVKLLALQVEGEEAAKSNRPGRYENSETEVEEDANARS